MTWHRAYADDIQDLVSKASAHLFICSPYYSRAGLNLIQSSIPATVQTLEFWTRMDLRDWVGGSSDPEALLHFLENLPPSAKAEIRVDNRLHAKVYLANADMALAGSSNLTSGGFGGNIEILREITTPELYEIQKFVTDTRPLMTQVSLDEWRSFVTTCMKLTPDREALLDLIRDVTPPPIGKRPLIPITRFMDFCEDFSGPTVAAIRTIYYNTDSNNRTGHLKQAYYGIQRFLQEYPQHIGFVTSLPEAPFDLVGSLLDTDWFNFIHEFHDDEDELYAYDLSILIDTYLTPKFGGVRLGGGGGNYPFELVWAFVGRLMAAS